MLIIRKRCFLEVNSHLKIKRMLCNLVGNEKLRRVLTQQAAYDVVSSLPRCRLQRSVGLHSHISNQSLLWSRFRMQALLTLLLGFVVFVATGKAKKSNTGNFTVVLLWDTFFLSTILSFFYINVNSLYSFTFVSVDVVFWYHNEFLQVSFLCQYHDFWGAGVVCMCIRFCYLTS